MADETVAETTETTEQAAPTTEAAASETQAPAASVVPEKYELALPKDSTLDASVLDRTAAIARERGLSNDAAQAMVEYANEIATAHAATAIDAYKPGGAEWQKAVAAELAKTTEAWKAETAADSALGKTPAERLASVQKAAGVLDKFETVNPEMGKALKEALNASGIAERREIAHFLLWIGKAASESPLVQGGASDAKTPAQKMYSYMAP